MCLSDKESPDNRTEASVRLRSRQAEAEAAPVRPDRRAILEKLGELAAWTPPVMLTLLLNPRASAASAGGGGLGAEGEQSAPTGGGYLGPEGEQSAPDVGPDR
jgi:hypothetical protein